MQHAYRGGNGSFKPTALKGRAGRAGRAGRHFWIEILRKAALRGPLQESRSTPLFFDRALSRGARPRICGGASISRQSVVARMRAPAEHERAARHSACHEWACSADMRVTSKTLDAGSSRRCSMRVPVWCVNLWCRMIARRSARPRPPHSACRLSACAPVQAFVRLLVLEQRHNA